jgi:hypothetical protein
MLSPTAAAGGDRVEETDDPGLAVRFEGLSPAGPPARLARRAVPNNSATVIMWATESIRREWWGVVRKKS